MKCLEKVEELIKNCKPNAALEELESILYEEPENADARILFGVCRQMQGRTEEFCQVYRDLAPTLSARESAGEDSPVVARWRHFCKVASYLVSLGLVTLVGGNLQTVHAETTSPAMATSVFSIENELKKPEFVPILAGTTNLIKVSHGEKGQLIVARGTAIFDSADDEDEIDAARRAARSSACNMILEATNSPQRRPSHSRIQFARAEIERKGQGGVVVAYYYCIFDEKPSEGNEVHSRYNMGGRSKYNMGGRPIISCDDVGFF